MTDATVSCPSIRKSTFTLNQKVIHTWTYDDDIRSGSISVPDMEYLIEKNTIYELNVTLEPKTQGGSKLVYEYDIRGKNMEGVELTIHEIVGCKILKELIFKKLDKDNSHLLK